MTTPLSPAAQHLLNRLTAPKPDHAAFTGVQEDAQASLISREELGTIWVGVAQAASDIHNRPAYDLAMGLYQELRMTQRWPQMTDAQVQIHLSGGQSGSWRRALEALAWRTHRSFPLPNTMVAELRRILGTVDELAAKFATAMPAATLISYARNSLCIAHHLEPGGKAPELAALGQLLVEAAPELRYRRMELSLLLTLQREELLSQCWSVNSFDYQGDARYREMHEQVLRDACAHVDAIHSGDIPYVPYKAFAEDDIDVVAAAYRFFATASKAPAWMGELLGRLMLLLSHAPDKLAKSMPSQTLSCRLAEEISKLPTPEAIASLHAAAKETINATVKKVLEQRTQQAKTALALRPEIVLDLVASGEPDKKQQTMLATLLQSSYWSDLPFKLADWRTRLALSSGAGDFTRQLIWLAQGNGADAVAFMAESVDGGLRYTDHNGKPLQLKDEARVMLWHPLHSTREVRQAWQRHLAQRQLRQPLRQAFREHYAVQPEDLQAAPFDENPLWHANENWQFAGYMLKLKPLIGLARGEGWKLDKDRSGLVRVMGLITVKFDIGAEIYPGVDGDADSLSLNFWREIDERRIRVPLEDVPPVIYSEACRAADLLVSVASYAYTGDELSGGLTVGDIGLQLSSEPKSPRKPGPMHPIIRRQRRLQHLSVLNIADMTAIRQQVLAQAFAAQVDSGQLKFDRRIATVGDYTVNLSTARVSKFGEQVEVRLAKPGKGKNLAALPWLPYDEVLLEKLVGTLAALV